MFVLLPLKSHEIHAHLGLKDLDLFPRSLVTILLNKPLNSLNKKNCHPSFFLHHHIGHWLAFFDVAIPYSLTFEDVKF